MTATFIEAASILLREGLEAILVLLALAAYLARIGASDRLKALWTGAGLAVAVSIGIAWIFNQFYGGAHSDVLESVLIFITAAMDNPFRGAFGLSAEPYEMTYQQLMKPK